MFGYLKSHCKAKLIFDFNDSKLELEDEPVQHGWHELYPNTCEKQPPDMPIPKMKPINVTAIYDASHAPCLVTRRSVTGIILMLNNFILRCTSTRPSTIESATYGAEMVAGRLAVE